MRRVVYDTGVYIAYLRSGEWAQALETTTRWGIVHFSAVVAEELLVGAPSAFALRFLESLIDRFDAVGRLVVPNRLDWLRTGRAIREVGRRHGYHLVGRARLTNDALILASALSLGATVVTRNVDDFTLLQDHLRTDVIGI